MINIYNYRKTQKKYLSGRLKTGGGGRGRKRKTLEVIAKLCLLCLLL